MRVILWKRDDLISEFELLQQAFTDMSRQREDLLGRLLRDAVAALTTRDATERFDAVDLLSAPLLTLREALEDPQVLENGTVTTVDVEGRRTTRILGNPVRLSRTPASVGRGVSGVGADTEAVLREAGFDDDELRALRESGAVR